MNKIFRWLLTNLSTFLLAFILALAVWVMAVTTSNPDKSGSLPESIPIEFIGQDPRLVLLGEVPESVDLSLRAPESVWDEISSDHTSVRAIVDLTGLDSGVHQVQVLIQINAAPVRILSVTPESFTITLEPLLTIVLPVDISITGEPAISYKIGDAALTPEEVVISGPESIVSQVVSAQLNLDITDARTNIEIDLPLVVLDTSGSTLTGLSLSPKIIHVALPVEQMGGYRDLAVKVVTVGRAASGYRLASVAAFPAIVTVYSTNLALIESLPGYVETTALDLSGASQNIESRLNLILPADVTLLGDQTIVVQVGITPIEDSMTISDRPVVVIGLSPGLKAQVSPVTVDVILSGPIPALESLKVSDVIVNVDASGRTAGTYQLVPIISISIENVIVQSILPSSVQVTITGTATPSSR